MLPWNTFFRTIAIGLVALLAQTLGHVCDGGLSRSAAQDSGIEKRTYETRRVDGAPPVLDGRLDDPAWDSVPWAGEFLEHDPARGEAAAQPTAFKILYDDDALYVAFRAYDSDPSQISRLTTRRDWFPGDWVEINIDSVFDQRTAYSFTASVSGVRGDEFISQDGNHWDGDWDPIWSFETAIDGEGWTAEIRIPLSQLRFADREEHVWGIQATRRVFREEERSTWQPVPQDTQGWVSRFGELHGIRGIRPRRQIELLPYAVATAERYKQEVGNPFASGRDEKLTLGLDGKVGVTSDLTLNFTVNPDFGQVEADPSEVNLSAFETFFSERRPFFIEGANIFEYRVANSAAGGSFTQDRLFYSRRIGGRPSYSASIAGANVDLPTNTSILASAKLSGKTRSGFSIGILEGVTAKEEAEIDLDGARSKQTVEPAANFLVGRVRKDLNRGQTVLGAMFTAVNRGIDDVELEFLHDAAYSGGLDMLHNTLDRNYTLEGKLAFSRVQGSEQSILRDQRRSARYYQRPDADHVELDSTRTSLSGHAGSLSLAKFGGGVTRFQVGAAWRSPGFELNDVGFLRRADEINQFGWFGLQFNKPFSVFRRLSFNANEWVNHDFGGVNTSNTANINTNATFKNNWRASAGLTRDFEHTSNTALRGGPSSKWPGSWNANASINSDDRRAIQLRLGGSLTSGDDDSETYRDVWLDFGWRPSSQIRVSLNPSYSVSQPKRQYVTTTERAGGGTDYVFAALDQETAALTFRLDYALQPDLTIQYYGQPFVAAGKYDDFQRVRNPRASRFEDRFEPLGQKEIPFDPDFNFREFNSNLVVRWEYQPGSLLYLVWNQSREGFVENGQFSVGDDLEALFDVYPRNIFLIKVSRWFSL